ncbi:DUF2213 domain-containing protein [Acinetobacter seifertii]|uniref:DUF2213 domain-containing protein n=1 Tax=Acinetobacter seifertii TaxID=1530123 RepID=UPI00083A427C|nr:DUF2213 domain-containing protein [Acinetobacter seifertii]OCZ58470.1 hypothetical protein A7P21_15380 [Acinetobacter seifertii]
MFKSKKTKVQKTADRSNILTSGQIGRTRELTPEGYLLCRDVRLARTGILIYGDGEVPIKPDNTGLIQVYRGEDVLFSPTTISSGEGKPVTNDHPDDWVSAENWKEFSGGSGHNVHRGEGEDAEYLMGDLLVMDKEAIDAVMAGKVEISLGYDAEYTEISPGKGVQSNIVINHIALVDKGRCGSRCSIGDSFMTTKVKKKKISFADRIRNLVKTGDADEAEKIAKAVEDEDLDLPTEDEEPEDDDKGKTNDAAMNREILKMLKTMDSRLSRLEDDPENKTKDDGDLTEPEGAEKLSDAGVQTYTGDSLKEVLSRAEILSPGYRMPTFDSVNNGKAVLNTKRAVLKTAYATQDGQKAIAPFVGPNPDFDKLPTYTIDAAFAGASELIKQQNNAKGVRSGISTRDFGRVAPTPAQINQRNREFWNKQG